MPLPRLPTGTAAPCTAPAQDPHGLQMHSPFGKVRGNQAPEQKFFGAALHDRQHPHHGRPPIRLLSYNSDRQ